MGLGGFLRERSEVLSGILNGIDTSVWNPETDPHIAARFSAKELESRAANKAALQRRLGLDLARGFAPARCHKSTVLAEGTRSPS